MKVSVNWLKQFTSIDISVDELVAKIGAQLGAVEDVIDLGKKYRGIVIAKVVSCDKHPNADKLNVCMVDDGGRVEGIARDEHGLVQVVCGAPNVRAGLTVAWLPPGATVPSTYDKDPFVLGARELRGVVSNGMLASASELAISDDHDGIVELELDVPAGTDFAAAYQLDDYIIDIENKMFTHRPDCFGLLGVAREVAGIQHTVFTSPEWYQTGLDRMKPGKHALSLQISNNVPELVPRLMAIAMTDVHVRPSPFMLQTYLSRVGLRPINNIVDITNYVMFLTGQPLHAYDADKLQKYGPLSLETRLSRAGDTLNLLNGKTIELKDDTTVLITSNDTPVGLAGVMGGADTEVGESSTNIVIECANFDMYNIRRTSMKYGLFTDAVTRFNKGQSPLQNERVLEEAVAMIMSLAGASVASGVLDSVSPSVMDPTSVQVSPRFINDRLGVELSADEIATLLQNVEFSVQHGTDILEITPPFWRTDIAIAEDIVEEVGRLYGYDMLPLQLPLRDLSPVQPDTSLEVKRSLREALSRAGANEVLTYSFVHGDLLERTGQDKSLAFKLSNALSPDLQYYRLSVTPSLLEKVHANIKAGFREFALFEIGKTHNKIDTDDTKLPKEYDRVSLVVARDQKQAEHIGGTAYYEAKLYAETILAAVSDSLTYVPFTGADLPESAMFKQLMAPYEPLRSAVIFNGNQLLGVVGEYRASVARALKLPAYCAGFELFLSPFIKSAQNAPSYQAISRFPKVEQDITLRVPVDMPYGDIAARITECLTLPEDSVYNVRPLDIFQSPADSHHKHVTFRVAVTSYVRTLTADEINTMLDQAASQLTEAERM